MADRMSPARLLDALFPGESGAGRLRRFGLLMVVYALEGDGPVTAARIAALAHRPAEAVRRDLNALAALGLVRRARVPRGPGRGSAWRLALENPEVARLLATLAGAAAARAG
jgi:predicted ArsR family transcriptional regulator